MLNRRGFFKAAAAVTTVAAAAPVAEAAPALAAEVEVQRIPDGPVVGIGYQPLLETLTDPMLAARVVKIYAAIDDQSSVWMHFMQQEPDNWRAKMQEAQDKIEALKAAGKFNGYVGFNDIDMRYDDNWPDEANGEWQAYPFVTIGEQRLLDAKAET